MLCIALSLSRSAAARSKRSSSAACSMSAWSAPSDRLGVTVEEIQQVGDHLSVACLVHRADARPRHSLMSWYRQARASWPVISRSQVR